MVKMVKNEESSKEFIERLVRNCELVRYYKERDGLLFVGLNDSLCMSQNSILDKKSFLEQIKDNLTTDVFQPKVIDMFSLTLDKTEHIDMFLKNNLSLAEFKLIQLYSKIEESKKILIDSGFSKKMVNVLNTYDLTYKSTEEDKKVFLTSTLMKYKEPVVVYSSGFNNLMKDSGFDTFLIEESYKKKTGDSKIHYNLEKNKNSVVIKGVIEGNRKNFEHLLSINGSTDIYTLGAFIPSSMNSEDMKQFSDLVACYNDKLKELCDEYQLIYIDTMAIVGQYCKSKWDFRISKEGQKILCEYILNCIYENKIKKTVTRGRLGSYDSFQITNQGLQGMIDDIQKEYIDIQQNFCIYEEYDNVKRLAILDELMRERDVFKKALVRSKR